MTRRHTASSATPAGSMDPPPGTPPVELTTFIGREAELPELERLVGTSRLLTLTGAGGSGKTRLAGELAAREAAAGRDVAWVELAPVAEPALIPQQVAEALGVPDEVSALDALVRIVSARAGLLVLDNCEHLVDACAELAHTLLRACPGLRILATSREALGVKGERAWLVPPLSFPASVDRDPGDRDPGSAATFEAVRLFVERARDALPEFELTAENAGAVMEVCRRLDGIPLAIELAAARVRVLPPEPLRQRLDDAFQVLSAGGRTAVPRHRTLRATMDWSHDLLLDASRVLLRRQAVFRGGFTLESAEAVCAGDGIEPDEVLDLVARLVDRSLLVVREHEGAARYGPLETVRQYALERLLEAGEEHAVRARHAAHVMKLVEDAAGHANTPQRRRAFDRLLPELENIREALTWSRTNDPRLHLRLAGKLGWFWFSIGHWTDARRWMEEALSLPEAAEPGRDRATLLFAVGALATLQGHVAAARPWLEESVALAGAGGFEDVRAYALNYLGMSYIQEGRLEGRGHCSRAEAWFRENEDDYGLRLSLLLLGVAAQLEGRPEEALRLNAEGVAVARRFGQDRELSVSLQNLATIHVIQGDLASAEPLLLEAVAAARRDPSLFFIANTVEVLAEVRLRQGRLGEGARILGAADAVRELIGARPFKIHQMRLQPLLERLRAEGQGPALDAARAEGRSMSLDALFDFVLARVPEKEETRVPADDPVLAAPLSASAGAADPPAPGTTDLRISALGPLEVAVRGERLPEEAWSYAKPKELLVLLALHPAGRTRDQLGRALWPASSAAQAKNSFHVTLHHLRKTLGGAEWVVIEGDRYRLAPTASVQLDAERFEEEARSALRADGAGEERLRAVLGLYRGELLEGEVTGSWVEEVRDRLHRLFVELCLARGSALESAGDHNGAAEVYQAIAAREDLNEEAHRRLMAAWARTGDRARALRHYQRLVTVLQQELEAEPEPETVELYESLRLAGSA